MTRGVARRRWRVLASVAAILFVSAVALIHERDTRPEPGRRADAAQFMNDLMSGKVPIGGPFTLKDPHGRAVSLSDFRGKVVLLYFGFMYCPDVCPTDLLAIGELMGRLGADAERVQPVFVTLDPARDEPAMLRSYVSHFDRRFVALTGTDGEIRKVATAYKVFYEKVELPGASTYTIDHMSFTFIIDTEGKYIGAFPRGTPPDRMEPVVREVFPS